MASTTASPRRRAPLVLVALVALLVPLGAACSSDDDAAPSDTTGVSDTSGPDTSVPADTTTSMPDTTSTPPSSGPTPSSPSTLPPSVDGPCAALAETLGLDQIQPRNSSSWVDERQRIVVDARREAQLLGAAQQGAPAAIADHLATMQAYASWLATTVEGAGDYTQAVTAIGAYPDSVSVSLAVASVQTWQRDNCPT
jgi:hypothetical protein